MMCQRIGRSPMGAIGLGMTSLTSRKRVPCPPHRMAVFMMSYYLKRGHTLTRRDATLSPIEGEGWGEGDSQHCDHTLVSIGANIPRSHRHSFEPDIFLRRSRRTLNFYNQTAPETQAVKNVSQHHERDRHHRQRRI